MKRIVRLIGEATNPGGGGLQKYPLPCPEMEGAEQSPAIQPKTLWETV